ncbi:MAG: hypothetical protein JOZ47_08830 [Kutzneria sp.]|nr:hypothetical protein [Kutzneria sp.]
MDKPGVGQGFSASLTLERIVVASTVAQVSAIVRRLSDNQVSQVITAAREPVSDHNGNDGEARD